jgi:hypothetical protein
MIVDRLDPESLSFAKTRLLIVLIIWEMGVSVVGLDYMRPMRIILEWDDILPKDRTIGCFLLPEGRLEFDSANR